MLPNAVWIPWWSSSKNKLPGITIQPLHTHADCMLGQLAEKLADTSTTAGVKEGDDKLPEEASSSKDAGKDGGKDGGKSGEKGGGKDGQPLQKRGGWLPKMVKLVRAIKSEDWWQVQQLADEYLNNWSLKDLVDKADAADGGWKAHKGDH
jgi:hypothetical protein